VSRPSLFSVSAARQQTETTVPADILVIHGTCIANEAMLSGESTPLLKESIQLLEGTERLDVEGSHKTAVLFSGTKILQAGVTGKVSELSRLMRFNVVLRTRTTAVGHNIP
jgi:manganese-transporting P-type ATPase